MDEKRYVVRTRDAFWSRGMVFVERQRDAARMTRAEARAKLAQWEAVGWRDMRVVRLVPRADAVRNLVAAVRAYHDDQETEASVLYERMMAALERVS